MRYKRPIIALTSLFDLLLIMIFAYQIEIKSNAENYVQAEVQRQAGIPIDEVMTKKLVGSWQGECERGPTYRNETTTYFNDGKFASSGTIHAIRDFTLMPAETHLDEGDSLPYKTTGSWWIINGYRFLMIESSTNTKAWPVGYSVKDRISFTTRGVQFMRDGDNVPCLLRRY